MSYKWNAFFVFLFFLVHLVFILLNLCLKLGVRDQGFCFKINYSSHILAANIAKLHVEQLINFIFFPYVTYVQ